MTSKVQKARLALAEAVLRVLEEGPKKQATRKANKEDDRQTGMQVDVADSNVHRQRSGPFARSSSRSVDSSHVIPDEDRDRAEHASDMASDAARRRGANVMDALSAGKTARDKALGRAFRARTRRPRRKLN